MTKSKVKKDGKLQLNNSETQSVSKENTEKILVDEDTDGIQQKKNRDYTVYLYEKWHMGPFHVYLVKLSELKEKYFSQLDISMLIRRCNVQGVEEVIRSSRNAWEILFKSRDDANKLVHNQEIVNNNFKAFIPKRKVIQKGIIRGVPKNLSTDDFIVNLCEDNPKVCAMSARRLKRKVKVEGKNTWVDTSSVVVDFKSQSLPEKLYLWNVRVEVSPFVANTPICYNCGKLDHIKVNCKVPAKCLKCGKDKHTQGNEDKCEEKECCLNCKGPHHTLSNHCLHSANIREIKKKG